MLAQIKAECPQTRCVVLADQARQERLAKMAGADVVVLKGYPASKLVATIKDMLPQQ